MSLTGLVVGSITPDFEYFIRMQKLSLYSHSLPGVLFFNLPTGILLTFIYHGIVHKPLIYNLPSSLRARLLPYVGLNWIETFRKNWLVIMVSLMVGTLTHLMWDSFVFAVVHYFNSGFEEEQLSYYNFWGLNSVLGAGIICFALLQLPAAEKRKVRNWSVWYWSIVASTAMIVFTLRALAGEHLFIRDYIVSLVTATIAGLILASIFFGIRVRAAGKTQV